MLSIPFGMLPSGRHLHMFIELDHFQSLLGCFETMEWHVSMIYIHTFNPFWDASIKHSLNHDPFCRRSFNPFWDASFDVTKIYTEEEVTFNPFWDASRCEFLQVYVIWIQLSIPFGMLPNFLKTVMTYKVTFNPFWDASNVYAILALFFQNHPFNPFWDASKSEEIMTWYISIVLSIPFGMLHFLFEKLGIKFNSIFQSLLGCFEGGASLVLPPGYYNFQSLLGCFIL